MDKLNFSYNETTDIITIEGVKYSGAFFRSLAAFRVGEIFEIEMCDDGLIEAIPYEPRAYS